MPWVGWRCSLTGLFTREASCEPRLVGAQGAHGHVKPGPVRPRDHKLSVQGGNRRAGSGTARMSASLAQSDGRGRKVTEVTGASRPSSPYRVWALLGNKVDPAQEGCRAGVNCGGEGASRMLRSFG